MGALFTQSLYYEYLYMPTAHYYWRALNRRLYCKEQSTKIEWRTVYSVEQERPNTRHDHKTEQSENLSDVVNSASVPVINTHASVSSAAKQQNPTATRRVVVSTCQTARQTVPHRGTSS